MTDKTRDQLNKYCILGTLAIFAVFAAFGGQTIIA